MYCLSDQGMSHTSTQAPDVSKGSKISGIHFKGRTVSNNRSGKSNSYNGNSSAYQKTGMRVFRGSLGQLGFADCGYQSSDTGHKKMKK